VRRPTARHRRLLRKFFSGGRLGLAPAHYGIYAASFLVGGIIVVADGYLVVGLLIVAFAAFSGYATVLQWRHVGRYDSEQR
jgi:hypothetical protein